MTLNPIKIIECPRDAMQGIHEFIPTENKIDLIKSIIKCGFDTIDCGSFVSSKHIPQLADTPEMLRALENEDLGDTKLLTIVANERGAVRAAAFPQVTYLGYPFSISENFQMRNTNKTIKESEIFYQKSFKSISCIPLRSRFSVIVARRVYKKIGYFILKQKNDLIAILEPCRKDVLSTARKSLRYIKDETFAEKILLQNFIKKQTKLCMNYKV